MVSVNNVSNNPQQPFNQDNAYLPDQLIAGVFPRVTDNVTVLHSAAVNSVTPLPRGTVMGQVTVGSATSAAKSGGNTGTGTLVLDVTTPVLANAIPGIYTVRNIEAVTNGGKFQVIDPKGLDLGMAIIVAGAGGTVTFANRIKFVLTDATTDFIVGDGFDITVAAGSLKYVPSVATATDGSQNPTGLLVDQTDPSAADVVAGIYKTGEFNLNAITFDSSWTTATLTPVLRALSIFLKSAVTAADPS